MIEEARCRQPDHSILKNPITSDFKRYGGPHKPSTKCNNSPSTTLTYSHSYFHNFSVRGILFTQNDYLFGIFDGKQLPGVIATNITSLSFPSVTATDGCRETEPCPSFQVTQSFRILLTQLLRHASSQHSRGASEHSYSTLYESAAYPSEYTSLTLGFKHSFDPAI